ncbi:MAG: hypothetical protein HY619_02870 [Thaumarchaeota archaeon]|nr:hypothetical protein [Nitrososphaerota archaeon]
MPESRTNDQIRIVRAGAIQFFSQIFGLVTGLAFTTLIIRNISLGDFGVWQLVGSLAGTALFPSAVIAMWSIRGAARGEPVGRTSLIAGLFTTPISGMLLWILFAAVGTRIENILLVFASAFVYLSALVLFESMKGVVQGSRPSIMGYSALPFELVKLVLAYYLVVVARWGLQGVILAVAAAYLVQDILLLYAMKAHLRTRFDFRRVVSWARASWVPALQVIYVRIWLADSIVVGILTGLIEPIGLMQAARVFMAVIAYSEVFPKILYSKLIRDRKSADISVASRMQALLGIPMAIGAFVLAEDLLAIFGSSYLPAATVLRFLALLALIEGFEHLMSLSLQGADTHDFHGTSFSNLRSSWLVKLPLLELIKSGVYYVVLVFGLLTFGKNQVPDTIITVWAFSYGISVVPFTLVKAYFARRLIPHSIPIKEIALYSAAGVVMGMILYLGKRATPSATIGTIDAILQVGMQVLGGAALYFILVFLLDSYSRRSVKALLQSLRGR